MTKSRQSLLSVQFFASLGNAMVGIFFPFLLARAFDLSFSGVLVVSALLFLGMMLTAFPINHWLSQRFSSARTLQMGILLHALFYLILSVGTYFPFLLFVTILVYILATMVYWPTFHTIVLHNTKEGGRGKYAGYLQIFLISANVVAPVMSGFLLERNLDGGILILSTIFFVLAFWAAKNLSIPKESLPKFAATWKFFRKNFFKTSQLGFWLEGVQGGVLWVIWPLFLESVLGNFSLMGILVSVAAIGEMASSRFFGGVTDKYGASKALSWGAFMRSFDIGIRSLLIFFPSPVLAGIITLNAGLMGPSFQLPWYARMCELREYFDHQKNSTLLEFFVVREWILGFGRAVIYIFAAGATYLWGTSVLGWFLLFAGLATLGFRWQR
jgi:hypothetical protein